MTQALRIVVASGQAASQDMSIFRGEGAPLWWDRRDVPEGHLSVPELLEQDLPRIRAELVAWVYELGRLDIGGQELQERLKAGDALSMWWCSLLFEKHPKMLPGLYEALKLRALELYLEKTACTELHLHGADAKLSASLAGFCRARKLCFSFVDCPAASSEAGGGLARLYYSLPAPCKAVLRFFHWLWKVKRHLPRVRGTAPDSSAGLVATYFPNIDLQAAQAGSFRSNYWTALHDALSTADGRARVNWLMIFSPSSTHSLRECMDFIRAFRARDRDGASFHYLEEFLGLGDILACIWRYLRLCVSSARMQSRLRANFCLGASHMNLWPWLGWAFVDSFRGWRALERCLQRRACLRYAAWLGPQAWTIFPMENCPWERMLTQALREAGHGPVYGTQHSTLRCTDFRYFDDQRTWSEPDCRLFQPTRLFGNGQGALTEMFGAGYSTEQVGIVEALRYLYLAPAMQTQQLAPTAAPSADFERIDVPCDPRQHAPEAVPTTPHERRLLLVTSFFAEETDAHLDCLAQAARQGLLAGLRVLVKAHPYLDVRERLHRLFPQGGGPELVTGSMDEWLKPGTLVWASNSTSVALEAALRGLPLMVQLAENDFDLCPLQALPDLVRIRNCLDLQRALAAPSTPRLPRDYLALDSALPRWRALLGL